MKGGTATALTELTLTRRFHVPREVLFRAWLDPKQLAEWWGAAGFRNPACMVNPRPGGSIHIDMISPDGVVYLMRGRYVVIDEPERLVFTTEAVDNSGCPIFRISNTAFFMENGEGSTITVEARVVHARAGAAEYLSGMPQAWGESLDRLGYLIAGLPSAITAAGDRKGRGKRPFLHSRELGWDGLRRSIATRR